MLIEPSDSRDPQCPQSSGSVGKNRKGFQTRKMSPIDIWTLLSQQRGLKTEILQIKWFLLIRLHGHVVIEKPQYFNNEILRKALSQMCIIHIHTLVEGFRPFFIY